MCSCVSSAPVVFFAAYRHVQGAQVEFRCTIGLAAYRHVQDARIEPRCTMDLATYRHVRDAQVEPKCIVDLAENPLLTSQVPSNQAHMQFHCDWGRFHNSGKVPAMNTASKQHSALSFSHKTFFHNTRRRGATRFAS